MIDPSFIQWVTAKESIQTTRMIMGSSHGYIHTRDAASYCWVKLYNHNQAAWIDGQDAARCSIRNEEASINQQDIMGIAVTCQ